MKVKVLKDIVSYGKDRTVYAIKGEELVVNIERDNMLYIKGVKQIFPVNKNDDRIYIIGQ